MQLLQHFKALTLHTINAAELKALILQLAIHGKLTKKWREERIQNSAKGELEPASELLKRIQAEKEQLIREKKIKREKRLPAITEDEVSTYLPSSWMFCRLGEIGDWGAGATPLRTRSDYYGGEINWFKSGELNDGIIDYESSEKISAIALKQTSLRFNRKGDVLLAMYGATIGKTGLLAVDGTTNQAVCACTVYNGISNIYLHTLLKALRPIFLSQGEGGAQPNISRVKIRSQIIALPPLEEQKAIVSVVNQLFKEVEALEARTKERVKLKEDFVVSALNRLSTPETDISQEWNFLQPRFKEFFNTKESIKKLRETILQLAIQGQLTRKWREERTLNEAEGELEPASELLKRIQTKKEQLIREKKIKKEKPLPPITPEEIPFELPEGWVWCRLGEVMTKITDGTHHSPPNMPSGAHKYVSAKNIKSNGIQLNDITYVTEQHHKEIYARCNPELGDILFIKDGATTGVCCINDLDEEFSMLSSVALIKQPERILGNYLLAVFRSPHFYDLIRLGMSGVAITRVTIRKLKESIIPICSLEEQKAIVSIVNQLMDGCDQLEQDIEQNTNHLEDLMQSCVKEVVG